MIQTDRRIDRLSRPAFWAVLATLVGGSVRLYLMLSASVIAPDGTAYVSMARRMVFDWRGELPRDYPLGYPFLTLLSHACGGFLLSDEPVIAWQRSAQSVALVSGTLLIFIVFLLGRALVSERAGVLAAWIWALLPSAAALSADALSDMPNLLLMMLSLLLLLRGTASKTLSPLLLAGALSGAAYTIRPEGAEVALAGVLAIIIARGFSWSRRGIAVGLIMLGFASIGGTYAALEGGRLLNKQTWLLEACSSSIPLLSAGNALLTWPQSIIAVTAKLAYALRYVWFALGIAYLYVSVAQNRRMDRRGPVAILAVFHISLLVWFHHRAGYVSHRHTMVLALFFVILAAGALVGMANAFSVRLSQRFKSVDGVIVLGISGLLAPWLLRDINSNRDYIHPAAKFVRESNSEKLPNVVSQQGWVPFYAGLLQWASCPHASNLSELSELGTADLAAFDLKEPVPQVIHHRPSGRDVRMIEMARFTDSSRNRGVVIYRVSQIESAIRKEDATNRALSP